MLVCNYDPLVPEFYVKRRALEKETAKLKAKGAEHSGIEPALKRKVMHTISSLQDCIPSIATASPTLSSSPIPFDSDSIMDLAEQKPRKRLRRSADRDISSTLSSGTTDRRITRSTSRI